MTKALEILDREGLKGVTMRNLAAELGTEATSLYRHVPNKDALLSGLVSLAFDSLEHGEGAGHDWRANLRYSMRSFRHVFTTHPHLLDLWPAYAPIVDTYRHYEKDMATLAGAGFGAKEALLGFMALLSFTAGSARIHRDGQLRHSELEANMGTVLSTLPHVAASIRASDFIPPTEDAFEFGLETILNGLEHALTRN